MSLWTVHQHEWLRALGHPVLLLASDPALVALRPDSTDVAAPAAHVDVAVSTGRKRGATAATDPTPATAQSFRTEDRTGSAPATRRPPPPERPLAAPASSLEAGAAPVGTPRTDASAKKAALAAARGARRGAHPAPAELPAEDPLLQEIARASGLDASAFGVAAGLWRIDLARLRAEPLSKRALWQQMRQKGRSSAR